MIALIASAGVVMVLVTIAVQHARGVIDGADRWLGPDPGDDTQERGWGADLGAHLHDVSDERRPAEELVLVPDLRDADDRDEAGRRTGTD